METKNKRLTIRECKLQAKENMGRQSADLMLVGFASEVIMGFLGVITVMLSSFFVVGAVDYGLYKTFYRNSIGETIQPKDCLDGFRDKFGEAFLAGFVTQVISKIPYVLRIISYFSVIYSILAILGIGGFAQSNKYTEFGQGLSVFTALLSLCALFMLVQYSMAEYILMREEEAHALHALRKSRLAMGGYVFKYILFRVSFVLWDILGIITLGLSTVYSKAYLTAAQTVFFGDVYDNFQQDVEGKEELETIENDQEDNTIGGVHIG